MQVIDAHQHFWYYHPETHGWINEEMAVIRKDFLPSDLLPVLEENGVEGTVAVQADQTEKETDLLLLLAAENDFIKGVVGWVDLRATDIRERLACYATQKKLKGFRHILQGEEPAFMLQSSFLNGISALTEFGYTYDILIYPKHLTAAIELVKQHPDQPFVIDHIAKPYIKDGLIDEWKKTMLQLATFPNVCCKLSGMVTEADWKRWTTKDLLPYLDVVTEAFGTGRLLYGSDWPVCLVAADYAAMIRPVKEYFSSFTQSEQQQVFALNTISFYHL